MARPQVSPDKPLTTLEAAFVREYQADGNGTQAAIRAGAAPKSAAVTAARWLTKPNVAKALANVDAKAVALVQEQRKEAEIADAVASAAWIISKSVEIVEIGMAAAPVRGRDGKVIMVKNEDGDEVPAGYEAHNLAAANGALKLLASRHEEFSEKHEVKGELRALVVSGRLRG